MLEYNFSYWFMVAYGAGHGEGRQFCGTSKAFCCKPSTLDGRTRPHRPRNGAESRYRGFQTLLQMGIVRHHKGDPPTRCRSPKAPAAFRPHDAWTILAQTRGHTRAYS